jgi:hypothetical protein
VLPRRHVPATALPYRAPPPTAATLPKNSIAIARRVEVAAAAAMCRNPPRTSLGLVAVLDALTSITAAALRIPHVSPASAGAESVVPPALPRLAQLFASGLSGRSTTTQTGGGQAQHILAK